MIQTVKQKEKKAFETMKTKYGYKSSMAAPRLTKVVVAIGTGSGVKKNKDFNKHVMDRLAKITGQKPATRGAKKSIASFKIRQGDQVGVMVTLRGARMYGFLDKLINLSLPKVRDFQGVPQKLDRQGNYNLGIKEWNIFPEAEAAGASERIRGLNVTICTTTQSDEQAYALLKELGMPFVKQTSKVR